MKQTGLGVRAPYGKEQWAFMNSLKRMRIKQFVIKEGEVCDSDEDWREGDDHDLDEFVAQQVDEEKDDDDEVIEGVQKAEAEKEEAKGKDAKAKEKDDDLDKMPPSKGK
mmetsp:Transcript_14534/g.16796  ORF Transcript_14534/g.16796 Transcript_14534/m.16796 type:complete len:109 (-) Transcript_14534:15-341(-)